MARKARQLCDCGCGQAPASSCRQRLVSCSLCSVKARMSREALATVVFSCSCGGTVQPVCLLDRTAAGDESAWAEYMGRVTFSGVQSDRGRKGAQIAKISRAVAEGQARRAAVLAAQERAMISRSEPQLTLDGREEARPAPVAGPDTRGKADAAPLFDPAPFAPRVPGTLTLDVDA